MLSKIIAQTLLRIRYRIEKVLIIIVFALKLEDVVTQTRREVLGKKVWEHYGGEIAYGLFKGVKINNRSDWSGAKDIGPKVFGLYENQILRWIQQKKFDLFIDVGAADGYYALGILSSKIASRAVTFEISVNDREITKASAIINNVDDKIFIKGEATSSEIIEVLKSCNNGLIIMDIEGGENNLITSELLEAAKNCCLVIEIHEVVDKDIQFNMLELCKEFHNFEELTGLERDFPRDKFTEKLTDNERSLLLSEGRPYAMSWVALSPKVLK
jgi:hypothetical protein